MKTRKTRLKERNWALVFVASALILIGLIVVVLAAMHAIDFGWWSLLLGLSGLTTIATAAMSIVKNDPSWILLDLIIPG